MLTDEQRKEVIDVMDVGFAIYDGVKATMADGKVTWTDTMNVLPIARELPEAIKGFDTIPDSFKDAEEADRTYFTEHFKTELDLPNDELEALIEAVFNWVLQTGLLIKMAIDTV